MTLAMQGGPTPEFFGEVAVLVVVGALIAYACHRIGLLPIVGFLVTGVVIGPRRKPGQSDPTHEYVVLGTKRAGTMEEELLAEAANGFRLVGQSHYNNPSSEIVAILFDFPEMVAILERPLQD